MPAREVVLVEQQRAAADLPNHDIELAVVAEIARDDRPAIAIAVGPRQAADVQEVALALRPRTFRKARLRS